MGVKVPLNGILFWPGLNSAIGSGALANWSRYTNFDGKYFQGGESGFTTSANGGSATPNHTANAHGLTGNSHVHTFSGSGAITDNDEEVDEVLFSGVFIINTSEFHIHTHLSETSNTQTITYQNATPTVGTASAEPPNITVIAIKPDDANQDIPDDALCYTDNIALPGGDFTKFAAANGRFWKGAATGQDADTTGSGSATHNHPSSHTHTIDIHNHSQKTAGVGSPSTEGSSSSPTSTALSMAHHSVTLLSKSLSDLSSNDGNIASVNGEPAFVELLGIQNTSGLAAMELDLIIGYMGSEASIPTGWELVSATTDKQIRSTGTDGDVGNTGGSNSHGHGTSANHGHTHSGTHIHTAFERDAGSQAVHNTPNDVFTPIFSNRHNHSWSIGGTTPTTQNNTFTMSTDDGRFEYRTLIFIKSVPFSTVHIKGGFIKGGNIAA